MPPKSFDLDGSLSINVVLHRLAQYRVDLIATSGAGGAEILQELPPDLDRLVCHVDIVPASGTLSLLIRYHYITSAAVYIILRHVATYKLPKTYVATLCIFAT